jgi:hypothetical protein
MEYIYLIASSVIILTCFYFIIIPFFQVKTKTAGTYVMEEEHLTLEDVYSAVNELEMDYLMKKVAEQDFNQLKDKYQMLAAKLMNQEVKMVTTSVKKVDETAELEIYQELENIRKGKGRV